MSHLARRPAGVVRPVGGSSPRPWRNRRGQASVELVAGAPLAVLGALALAALLAAGATALLAEHAAQAGAIAVLQGRPAEQAARDALPGWTRASLRVHVHGRTVAVRLQPPGLHGPLAELLAGRGEASAGPASS